MKQRKKKKVHQLPAPRATKVNEVLRNKKGGAHEPKKGDHAKRARQKQQLRKELGI